MLGNGNEPQPLTEETVGGYSLQDVVLPLPGYDIILPTNDGVFFNYKATIVVGGYGNNKV